MKKSSRRVPPPPRPPKPKTRPKPKQSGSELVRRIGLLAALAGVPVLIAIAGYAAYVGLGVVQGGSEPSGTIAGLGVTAPASIVRDARGIPHIRAENDHDLYFLEGYAQGTDRLFQLDIYRRLVYGRLSEVLGSATLPTDENARTFDIAAIAQAQLQDLSQADRAKFQAFADGINAAIRTRPLPPEFRVLAYGPEPWTPKDSIASSFATVLALTDSWYDVAARNDVMDEVGPAAKDAFLSISDPRYDAPAMSGPHAPVAPLPKLTVRFPAVNTVADRAFVADMRAGMGSNDFVAGSQLTVTHRALLANDPHLELRIPGVWWLADLGAPGIHVAGVTLSGVPGIVLGHNRRIAWGATNGTVATVAVYREHFKEPDSDEYLVGRTWTHAKHRVESFGVRFNPTVTRDYLSTRHGFVFEDRGAEKLAAAWTADIDRRSSFAQFDGLNRAASAKDALAVLATYATPAQNFVIADDAGNAGYVLAGEIPIDDAWGITAHEGPTSSVPPHRYVPYAQLPHIVAAKNVLAFTANARPYAHGYPYRLSAAFAPPYRAAEIARGLAHRPFGIAAFSAIQADIKSLPEIDLAAAALHALLSHNLANDPDLHDAVNALRTFDGKFSGDSSAAVFVTVLRRSATARLVRYHMSQTVGARYLSSDEGSAFVAVMRSLRERPRGWVPGDDYDAFLIASMRDGIASLRSHKAYGVKWSDFGARVAQHPLAGFGLAMWNGTPFPGNGSVYSPHVQGPSNTQSFRAVWDIGNWNAGGIVIPQGESGEPGSPHYRDGAPQWLQGGLVPLPFDDADVARAAKETLALTP